MQPYWDVLAVETSGAMLLRILCPMHHWMCTLAWLETEICASKYLQYEDLHDRASVMANGVDSHGYHELANNGEGGFLRSIYVST